MLVVLGGVADPVVDAGCFGVPSCGSVAVLPCCTSVLPRQYLCFVFAWLSRVAVRGNPASFAWWCAHAVALLVLFLITSARGPWFWIIGAALVASSYVGQVVLNRRARR